MTSQQMPPPFPPTMSPPPPRKGWWSRNWKWALPLGCLTPILLCGGFVGTILTVVFGAIHSSDVYKEAVARAKSNPAVISALGTPIDTGLLPSGNIKLDNSSGDADLSIPIHGPHGHATIHAVATKSDGQWHYSTLSVNVDGTNNHIDLLPPTK